MVKEKRKLLPRSGTRKMHYLIKDELKALGIKVGRDKLFAILRDAELLVPRRKRFFVTTMSKHRFYKHPNRVKDLQLTRPEQLWVSDITYIKSAQGHLYLNLITDAFSRKIVGHYLSDNLKVSSTAQALKMALRNRKYPHLPLTHHSDRGLQYCSDEYTNILTTNQIQISMTQAYDPYENALAERVNGILKTEFDWYKPFPDYATALKEIQHGIMVYNTKRPHLSCDYKTPDQTHQLFNTFIQY